jgi:dihydrofolate synthase/folylpolyglutamate synthase
MNIDALLEKFAWTSAKLGLESSWQLLDKLGNPQLQVPIVHVAGTNGKGSVCAYLSSVLTAADYRVGRYTSPHLVDWNERICLNEQPIAPDDLERVLMQVVAAARAIPSLKFPSLKSSLPPLGSTLLSSKWTSPLWRSA